MIDRNRIEIETQITLAILSLLQSSMTNAQKVGFVGTRFAHGDAPYKSEILWYGLGTLNQLVCKYDLGMIMLL